MSLSHGVRTVRDGLVFQYDMNNSAKSWKGEPVTNVITITDLDAGWSQGYNTSIQWNDYKAPVGIKSQVVSFIDGDGNGSGYWYSYGDFAPQDPNTTYSISVYARTIGADWSIRAYTADNSELGRQYTNTLTCPGDGEWHRLEFNPITTPADTQSDSLSFNFTNIPAGQRCWLCAPQMTATSYHVPFVEGTRSNTQAILDISGQGNTITANGMLFDSNGIFSFDGTGTTDGVTPGSNLSITESITNTSYGNYPNGCTYDFWLKADSDSANRVALLWGAGTIRHIEIYTDTNIFRTEAGAQNGYRFGTGTFPDSVKDRWSHFSIVFANNEPGRPVYWYQNGQLFHTHASMESGTGGASEYFSFSAIGRATGNTNFLYAPSFKGQIPQFKIYSKSLSAAQVLQNFDATRGLYEV